VVALCHHRSLPAPRCRLEDATQVAAPKNFSFDFQSLLLPHFLAPEMCYTEDVVKILDQIVNDNLKANIYIQFQFPENETFWILIKYYSLLESS
jgi:hypothetical protein